MARTAFIAFAGFFVGSVVTSSIAYVAHEDLPPIPAMKPTPPVALAGVPPSTAPDVAMTSGEEAVPPRPRRHIATAGFLPNGPLFRFRTPSRAAAPMPPVPSHAPRSQQRLAHADTDSKAAVPGDTPSTGQREIQVAARGDVTAPVDAPARASVAPVPAPLESELHDDPNDLRPAWRRYAALTPPVDNRPMVAIVIDDVGLSQFRADRVIALPGPLTISILPYGANARAIANEARQAGHEIMVHMPMEPVDHHFNPGPNALLTTLDPQELQRRIEFNLSQFGGYVGVNNHMGSRFTSSELAMEPVMQALRARGLLFLDSVTSTHSVAFRIASQMGVPATARDVFIDDDVEPRAIHRQLRQIEKVARARGAAIAIGHPHPATLQALRQWLPRLSARGFVLVPISAITAMRLAG